MRKNIKEIKIQKSSLDKVVPTPFEVTIALAEKINEIINVINKGVSPSSEKGTK